MKRIVLLTFCMWASQLLIAQTGSQIAGNASPSTFILATSGIPVPAQPVAGLISAETGGTSRPQQVQQQEQVLSIPVVVHVIYHDASENISDEQIRSQIASLNKDYRGTNADRSKVPAYFAPLAADCGIEFRLAETDPKGAPTNGIVRKHTGIMMFGTDDRIKSTAGGGDDPWDRRHYLNLWVGNLAGGIMGYSSVPGSPAEKDGVVIRYTTFGTTGTAAAPFNLGRTATHEIGHWLNLKHIWGDAYCGDDEVDDTPTQRASNRGTPAGEKFTCGSTAHGDMYMNFMDLTDDAAMFMFTEGQKRRMRALFQSYGLRNEMVTSEEFPVSVLPPMYALPVPAAEGASHFSVYPNPAVSQIQIEHKSGSTMMNESVTIFNYSGQPVLMQAISSNRITVDISQLKPGFYFVKIGSKKWEPMMKFVKE